MLKLILHDLIKMLTDAALLYIDVVNDENGNNYQKEIISGRLGLKFPIKELVNKGYIKEEVEENIYKTSNLESVKIIIYY